jgi:acetyl esterase
MGANTVARHDNPEQGMIKRALVFLTMLLLLGGALLTWQVSTWMRTAHGDTTAASAVIGRIATWQEGGLEAGDVPAMRESRRKSIPLLTAVAPAMAEVVDRRIPGPGGALALRIYTPPAPAQPLPVVVYYHGGGWVLGDLDSHDNVCRQIAHKSGSVVVAVDYRLAPEHRFPAALDDAWTALAWVAGAAREIGADPTRIAVAGDSAGANLAAAVSLLARDRGMPYPVAQVLIYPALDLSTLERDSIRDYGEGFFLSRARMEWFIAQYVPDADMRRNPLVSPLLAAHHRGLPPALVITAQFDPLRDEGEAYAALLRRSGVDARLQRYDGVIHGFVSMDRWFPEAGAATDRVAQFLHEALLPVN